MKRSNNFETFKQPVVPKFKMTHVSQPPAGPFKAPTKLQTPKKGK